MLLDISILINKNAVCACMCARMCMLLQASFIFLSHYHFCQLSRFQCFSQLDISILLQGLTNDASLYSAHQPNSLFSHTYTHLFTAQSPHSNSHENTQICLKRLTDFPLRSARRRGCLADGSRRRDAVCSGVRPPSFSF